MPRDYRKLKVFSLADELVADVYVASRRFPPEERIGLQAQLRRSALAVPSNIIIGCERSSDSEYVHYSGAALASASETRYLLRIANRLGYLADETFREIEDRYDRLAGGLFKLIRAARDGDGGDRDTKKRRARNGDARDRSSATSSRRSGWDRREHRDGERDRDGDRERDPDDL